MIEAATINSVDFNNNLFIKARTAETLILMENNFIGKKYSKL